MTTTGVVYLLHFDQAYRHARHYTGWTEDLTGRLADHAAGRGARLLEVVSAAGIGWQLARTWPGDRRRERALKQQGGASRRCPLCGVRPPQTPTQKEVSASMTTTFEVLQLVLEERARQDAKWGEQNHQLPVFLAIIGEEFGELAQAILADEFGAADHSSHSQDIETEAVQVAASAVLLVEALRRTPRAPALCNCDRVVGPHSPLPLLCTGPSRGEAGA